MVVITPQIAVTVFIIVIIVAIFVTWQSDPINYDHSRAHIFIATLARLGIFITFLFYYSVVGLQQQQQRLSILQETSNISSNILDTFARQIQTTAEIAPQFAFSLIPLLPQAAVYESIPDSCSARQAMEVQNLSFTIFDLWQDVTLSHRFLDVGDLALNSNFLQRAHSPYLYQMWEVNKLNFNFSTQQYGDLLFEYGLAITDSRNPQAYVDAANTMMSDPRYEMIGFG